jgi:hypothetical protein
MASWLWMLKLFLSIAPPTSSVDRQNHFHPRLSAADVTTQGCREAPLRVPAVSRPPCLPRCALAPCQRPPNGTRRRAPRDRHRTEGMGPLLSRNRFRLPASLLRKGADRVGSIRGVTHRVGMSAAIDAVDLGTQRGGVLSLSADLRSTRSRSSCPSDSTASRAGRSYVALLNNSTSPSLSNPRWGSPPPRLAITFAPMSGCAARHWPQAPR